MVEMIGFSSYIDYASDYMTDADKSILYTMDLVDRAGNGDQGAKNILNEAAKDAAQESCEKVSDIADSVTETVVDKEDEEK